MRWWALLVLTACGGGMDAAVPDKSKPFVVVLDALPQQEWPRAQAATTEATRVAGADFRTFYGCSLCDANQLNFEHVPGADGTRISRPSHRGGCALIEQDSTMHQLDTDTFARALLEYSTQD